MKSASTHTESTTEYVSCIGTHLQWRSVGDVVALVTANPRASMSPTLRDSRSTTLGEGCSSTSLATRLSLLPPELLYATYDNASLPSVVAAERARGREATTDNDYIRARASYGRAFGALTTDPESLARAMLYTNTFLGGSRAVGFFFPDLCTAESDWDFYCCGGPYQRRCFLEFMKSIGFAATGFPNPAWTNLGGEAGYTNQHISMVDGYVRMADVDHSVQIIHTPYATEVETVLGFHSTAVRCYISGAEAVHLDSSFTDAGMMAAATTNYKSTPEVKAAGISKYTSRGLRLLPINRYRSVELEPSYKSIPITKPLRLPWKHSADDASIRCVVTHRMGNADMVKWKDGGIISTILARTCNVPYSCPYPREIERTASYNGHVNDYMYPILKAAGLVAPCTDISLHGRCVHTFAGYTMTMSTGLVSCLNDPWLGLDNDREAMLTGCDTTTPWGNRLY